MWSSLGLMNNSQNYRCKDFNNIVHQYEKFPSNGILDEMYNKRKPTRSRLMIRILTIRLMFLFEGLKDPNPMRSGRSYIKME